MPASTVHARAIPNLSTMASVARGISAPAMLRVAPHAASAEAE